MKNLIIILIFLFSNTLCSQILTEYEDKTIPLPPTEASLGTYSFSPVSLAKGELGLQIPIHTVKGRDLSLPISMSYRPGVKIHDASEYTGHGWSLFAGGVITRKVNDRIDPHPRFDWSLGFNTDENFNDMYTGVLDTAFDEFSYNFNGYTGQFILDHDLVTPYFIRDQRDWNVSITDNEIRITIEDGTEYVFNEIREEDIDYSFPEGLTDIATVSWYLTEIISPSVDERIEITYIDNNFVVERVKNNSLIIDPWLMTTYNLADPNDNDYLTFHVKRIEQIKLISDNTDISKVTFQANTLRQDTYATAPDSYALSRISVYDDPQNSQPSKYFEFDIENINNHRIFLKSIQEFSGDGSQSKPPYKFEYHNENSLPNRTTYKADHWGYYSSLHGGQFPFSTTFSWLNNPTREPSLSAIYGSLSKVTFPTGGEQLFNYELNTYNKTDWDYQEETLELFWANSSARWENYYGTPLNSASKNFIITDQQYMKLNFTMILDKFSGSNISELANNEVDDYKISIMNSAGEEIFYAIFLGDPGSDFPVSMSVYADAHIKFLNTDSHPNDTNSSTSSPIYSGFVNKLGFGVGTGYSNTTQIYNSYFSTFQGKIGEQIDRNLYLVMDPGSYTAQIETSTIDNNMADATIKLSFEYHNGNMINNAIPAGGIRIASQTIYDPLSIDVGNERTIHYNYVVSDVSGNSTTKSSGAITSKPLIPLYNPSSFGPFRGDLVDRYRLKSLTKHIENSWVYYSEVNESESGNGFKIHKFLNSGYDQYSLLAQHIDAYSPDQVPFAQTTPQFIWTSSWPHNYSIVPIGFVNKPFSTTNYKYANGAPIKVNEEKFEYNLIPRTNMLKGILAAEYYSGGFQTGYKAHLTKIDDIYSQLKSEEKIVYDINGNNPVSTKTEYDYDGKLRPNKITTTDSENNKIIKKLKYSTEYSSINFGFNSSIGIQDLKDKNIITPIEEQLWKEVIIVTDENVENNFHLIGAKLNIFDKVDPSNPNNVLINKSKIIAYKADTSMPYNIEYYSDNYYNIIDWFATNGINNNLSTTHLNYYHSGNLKEVSKENILPTIYIWGYNKTLPIAKIENATFAEVQNHINNLQLLSNLDTDRTLNYDGTEGDFREALNNLRNDPSLSKAMISTYTYDPLIGLTSMTDPRGYTLYYEYDNLNRLKHIKDKDGNILNENDYHYRN